MTTPDQGEGSAERLVARNFAALGAGEALARLVAFAATVYVARVLGPAPYGVVEVALAIILYCSRIADFGIDAGLGVREIAADPHRLRSLSSSVFLGRTAVSALVAGLLAIFGLGVLPAPEGPVLAIYGVSLLAIGLSTRWIHLGRERAVPVSVARLLGEVTMVALVLLFVRSADDLLRVPLAKVAGDLLAAAILYFWLRRDGVRVGAGWHWQRIRPLVPRAWSLVLSGLLGLMIFNADLLALRIFRGAETVGYYAAAYSLVGFLTNLGISFSTSLLPTLTRLRSTPEEQRSLYRNAHLQAFTVGLPIAIGGGFVASGIVGLVFGSAFAKSVLPLQILLWSAPLGFARDVATAGLVAAEEEHRVLRLTGWSTLLNVVLNLALIPGFGMLGAAAATVMTESVRMALVCWLAAQRGLPVPGPQALLSPVLAGAFMAALLAWIEMPLFLAIGVGAVAFAACLAATGGHRPLLAARRI
ncbi:MAG: flippase [Acidobacteriota bacterium]